MIFYKMLIKKLCFFDLDKIICRTIKDDCKNRSPIKKISCIVLTSSSKNNKQKKIRNINFWFNSKIHNLIQDAHKYWFLLRVDLMAMQQKKQ